MYFDKISKTSLKVVGSATVGPEAIQVVDPAGTSDKTRVSKVPFVFAASFPPFILLRCFLTVFISSILAPHFSKSLVVFILSCSVKPSSGYGKRAEPPPERRHMIISFIVVFSTNDSIFFEAMIPI